MKLLLVALLLSATIPAIAAPTPKRVIWEYATLDLDAARKINENLYIYGAELFLPGGKVLFLEAKNRQTPAYNTYLLNRLGKQGWELISVAGDRGHEQKYIFKRQK